MSRKHRIALALHQRKNRKTAFGSLLIAKEHAPVIGQSR